MKKSICFAGFTNDELDALKRAVAKITGTWECVFVADGSAAMTALGESTFDAIVATMKMDGLDGAQLLQKAGELNPKMLRFIISDVASQELIINCIGGTHQFIARPFKPADVITTIQRSFALDAWLSTDQLRTLVSKLRRLPSLPSTYFEVLKQVESPHATVMDIGQVIARDPAATARLLQMVNSAALALSQKITDPVEAVGLLGVETVKSLALCLQVFSQSDEAKQSGISLEQLWKHSFAVAKAAGKITFLQTRDAAMANDAFTAGLLHDVGRIVMASNLPREYGEVVAAARKNGKSLYEEEAIQFGVTHAQVGGYLLGLWGLPATLVEAAALHHEPSRSSWADFSILTAVHAANVLVHEQEGVKDGFPLPEMDVAYLRSIGLENKPITWRNGLASQTIQSGDTERLAKPLPKTAAKPAAKPVRSAKTLPKNAPIQLPVQYWFRKAAIGLTATAVFLGIFVWWNGAPKSLPVHAQSMMEVTPATAPITSPAERGGATGNKSLVANRDSDSTAQSALTPPAPTTGFNSVRLQGVFYSASNPSVIINGKTVYLGGHINGLEVVAIEMGSVTLAQGDEKRIFKVK